MKKIIVGWREWISLPELNISAIKAKVDTGARTSALHAYFIEEYRQNKTEMVKFGIHPIQKNRSIEKICTCRVIDNRIVTDSGGHKEKRYVIKTPIIIGNNCWDIEMTLTNRDTMLFRMLLGRTAMRGKIIVDPERSFIFGRK